MGNYHRIRENELFRPINIVYDKNHSSITDPNHHHFVLYKGTNIVAIAMMELLHNKISILRSLATDIPYRKQGYGLYIVNFLEEWVKMRGYKVIKTHARMNAEHFYRKLGYGEMEFDDPSISPDCINLGKII